MFRTPYLPNLLLFFTCLINNLNATYAEDHFSHRFERQQLTDGYFSEGANFGDLNHDGKPDVVSGPYWWAGPEFTERHEIYPAKPQDRNGYADNFFSWVDDFNGDGWNDVLTAGFPGTPAFVYENPGAAGKPKQLWTRHTVSDQVSNESPQYVNIVGDERRELVCSQDERFGYVTFDPKQPFAKQKFTPLSEKITHKPFGHALGIGDVDGDGKQDIIFKDGWLQQPKSLAGDPLWIPHIYPFCPDGGAEMHAYDVDGDGDNDVITSLQAHAYGLAWFEQTRNGDKIDFKKHLIMGEKPEENPYGVLFTEPHSVALVDIDGDGLKDIVTGKTYWSHHDKSPLWDAGAVVYWFKLTRGKDGGADSVDWVPFKADGETGIGRQISIGDLDGDKLPDIVVGGMKGCHVLHHKTTKVTEQKFQDDQPKKSTVIADGLTPQQAAERMTVPEGFHVRLAAGEPLVHQPVAFTIDSRGRLWVAEAYTYPNRAKEGEGKDKIIILEDTDGDGLFEKRKVFIEGLNLVSGLELGNGGVYVGAAPYLMFIPDRNGDDIPDGPGRERQIKQPLQFPKDVLPGVKVLCDGFGWQDTHETLNSFIWGPDGWLYGCHGVFTHSLVGKPGTEEQNRLGLNAGVWRYDPHLDNFEVFAHGTSNPWGVDFNDKGHAFITACVIPHLWHMIQGARYQRQGGQHFNPYTFEDIPTIADHRHYVGKIEDHAWWGHEPHAPADTLAAGGGHAHCGAMIYLGDNWPAKYRNQIFMNNVHGNRVNECLLEQSGSGYVGRRAPDLMIANDHWYRGINLKYGPDGSVFVIDWYDKNACHRTNPEIWDRTNGRIYNIRFGEIDAAKKKQVQADLTKLNGAKIDDLVELHKHANEWFVRMARQKLQELTKLERIEIQRAQAALENQFDKAPTVEQKLQILWTLHAIYADTRGLTRSLLDYNGENSEYLRAWAVQLGFERGLFANGFFERVVDMAKSDPSPVVRLYIASALQRLLNEQRWPIAEALLTHDDANDHNLTLITWYGIEPLVAADPARAIALAKMAKNPKLTRFIVRRAASGNESLNAAVAWLAAAKDAATQKMLLDEIRQAFEGRVNIPQPAAWTVAYEALLKSDDANVKAKADQIAVALGDKRILPRMRALLADGKAPLAQRQQALELLVKGRDGDAAPALRAALDEAALRGAAIRALAALDDNATPAALLARYGQLAEAEKRDAINTLIVRPTWAGKLFDAIEKGEIPRTDLHAYHVQQLLGFKDDALAKRITAVWGEIRATAKDKQEQIVKHKTTLTAARLKAADLGNGRRLYVKTCAACHTLFGEGAKIGPDITGSNRANLDYILENILDPSSIVGKDYLTTNIATKDGRVVNGLIQKETDSALTIRTINDTVVVAKSDIDERKLLDQSLMPERQLETLTADEIRDMIAYLGSPIQVALRGPKTPLDSKTGRAPGALEGESLKIVGKTGGNAGSQAMLAFTKDKWSGNDHLWWTEAGPNAKLELEIPVEADGEYNLEAVLTMAVDYGIVRLTLDGESLGDPFDCYNVPDVITSGVLTFGPRKLKAGQHKLGLEIVGKHPQAAPGYMLGLDYVRLVAKPKE